MGVLHSQDGTPIAYDKTGNGPPVILVDGALCYRAFGPARPLAKLLAEDFTVFTYDRRGRGESGDTQPYDVEREIEDLEALIKEAGGSACLYGISSGGALILEAAKRLPAVQHIAVYEVPFVVDDGGSTMRTSCLACSSSSRLGGGPTRSRCSCVTSAHPRQRSWSCSCCRCGRSSRASPPRCHTT